MGFPLGGLHEQDKASSSGAHRQQTQTHRDELDEDQGIARLLKSLIVVLLRVAVHDPGESHHLAGAPGATSGSHGARSKLHV